MQIQMADAMRAQGMQLALVAKTGSTKLGAMEGSRVVPS